MGEGGYPMTLPQPVIEALSVYVYRLVDPRDGRTFYVGKGIADRALRHAKDALATPTPTDKLDRIRDIHAAGLKVGIVIHRHGMDESTALAVEAALIDVYGLEDLANVVRGHGADLGAATIEELVQRYGAPDADIPVPAVIIKIEKQWRPGLTPEQLYERVRRYWVMNPKRRQLEPTHAIGVAKGIIREVYRIDCWEEYREWPADRDLTRVIDVEDEWLSGRERCGFVGAPDPELAHLKGTSVRHLMATGSQNPILYVGC